jgi:hypothetical protein
MAGVESRDFASPDETRTPDKTRVDVVRIGTTSAARFAFEPGWRWSDCVKPVAGTVGRRDEGFVGFEFESRSAEEYAKG